MKKPLNGADSVINQIHHKWPSKGIMCKVYFDVCSHYLLSDQYCELTREERELKMYQMSILTEIISHIEGKIGYD